MVKFTSTLNRIYHSYSTFHFRRVYMFETYRCAGNLLPNFDLLRANGSRVGSLIKFMWKRNKSCGFRLKLLQVNGVYIVCNAKRSLLVFAYRRRYSSGSCLFDLIRLDIIRNLPRSLIAQPNVKESFDSVGGQNVFTIPLAWVFHWNLCSFAMIIASIMKFRKYPHFFWLHFLVC